MINIKVTVINETAEKKVALGSYLTPSFLMPDQSLILKMGDKQVSSRQLPLQPASVRCRHFLEFWFKRSARHGPELFEIHSQRT